MQIAADSGAIAGASEVNYAISDGTTVEAAAKSDVTKNGFTDGVNGATVVVNNPPLNGPHATGPTNGGYVEVVVSKNQPAIFMALFGRSAMTVVGRAVATTLGKNE